MTKKLLIDSINLMQLHMPNYKKNYVTKIFLNPILGGILTASILFIFLLNLQGGSSSKKEIENRQSKNNYKTNSIQNKKIIVDNKINYKDNLETKGSVLSVSIDTVSQDKTLEDNKNTEQDTNLIQPIKIVETGPLIDEVVNKINNGETKVEKYPIINTQLVPQLSFENLNSKNRLGFLFQKEENLYFKDSDEETINITEAAHRANFLDGKYKKNLIYLTKERYNFGIGNTYPIYKLDVNSNEEDIVARFKSNDNTSMISISDNNYNGYLGVKNNSVFLGTFSDLVETNFTINHLGNIGIGTTSPTARLAVVGTSDIIQSIIRANATQTANLFEAQNSSGTSLFEITSSGLLEAQAGSASLPSYSFKDDPDTGIFRSGTNTLNFSTGGVERYRVDSNGNVGIGTTSPTQKLHVVGNILASGSGTFANIGVTNISASGNITALGNIGIGTTSPSSKVDISGSDINGNSLLLRSGDQFNESDSTQIRFGYNNTNQYVHSIRTRHSITDANNSIDFFLWNTANDLNTLGSKHVMTLEGTGNVGIGTTNPTAKLHVLASGTQPILRLQGLGAGSLHTDAGGNVTVSSDERLKNNIDPYKLGMDAILNIEPKYFSWNPSSGYESENIHIGFIAQNVKSVIPQAVGQNSNGYLTLDDRAILATLVNALKENYKNTNPLVKKIIVDELLVESSIPTLYLSSKGYLGLGTTDVNSLLSVGSGFEVNESGDIVKLKNVDYLWPDQGVVGSVLSMTDSKGTLKWVDNLDFNHLDSNLRLDEDTIVDVSGKKISFQSDNDSLLEINSDDIVKIQNLRFEDNVIYSTNDKDLVLQPSNDKALVVNSEFKSESVDIDSSRFRIRESKSPSSSDCNDNDDIGKIWWDNIGIHVCTKDGDNANLKSINYN